MKKQRSITVSVPMRMPTPLLEAYKAVAKMAGVKVDQAINVALAIEVLRMKREREGGLWYQTK